jgi:hypothetical protein
MAGTGLIEAGRQRLSFGGVSGSSAAAEQKKGSDEETAKD